MRCLLSLTRPSPHPLPLCAHRCAPPATPAAQHSVAPGTTARRCALHSRRAVRCHAASLTVVDVHAAYEAVVFGDTVVLDVRTVRDYDTEHLTKPPRRCFNVPFSVQPEVFAAAASKVLGRPLTRSVLVLTATGGPEQAGAAEALITHAGYTNVIALAGGWAEWRKHYTATSRPAPPPGRWIPTGQEALKSGLMSGDAAASYEERLNVEDLTKVGYDK